MHDKIFQNDRLTQAILIKGAKRKDLAEYCEITTSAVSRFENGENRPKSSIVTKMAEYLEVDSDFFYKQKPKLFISNIAFRKSKTTPKEKIYQAKEIAQYLTEIKHELIDEYADYAKLNLPDVIYNISYNEENIKYDEIEKIAEQTRRLWGLNDGPISNMIKLVECNGIFVFKMENNNNLTAKIDAFSWNNEDKPIIFLTKNKTAVRSRFDNAHELGHLILHRNVDINNIDADKQAILEKEADYFAGCFLLPTSSIINSYRGCHNLYDLFKLKEKWKLSVQMIAQRLKHLQLIGEQQMIYIYQQLSKEGYRQKDPLDDKIEHEEMFLFKEVIKQLQDRVDIQEKVYIKTIYNNLGLKQNINIIPFPLIKIKQHD